MGDYNYRIINVILIGYDDSASQNGLEIILKSYKIEFWKSKFFYDNYNFFEIQTPLMQSHSFCCLGKGQQLLNTHARLIDNQNDELALRTKKLYEDDIAFWKSLIVTLAQQLGAAILMRYYEDCDIKVTIDRFGLEWLSTQMLLCAPINSISVIDKCE